MRREKLEKQRLHSSVLNEGIVESESGEKLDRIQKKIQTVRANDR